MFFTRSEQNGEIEVWKIRDLTKGSGFEKSDQIKYTSKYWIATVPKDIIKDHKIIWSEPSMEMLTGLYRKVEQLGQVQALAQQMADLRTD